MKVYKIINQHVKNWWHNKLLRKNGQKNEARKNERESILNIIKTLKEAKKVNGVLSLGRCGYTFYFSENAYQSGYYGMTDYLYIEELCKFLGITIIDSRQLSFNDAIEYIKLPMFKIGLKVSENLNGSLSYCTVKDFIQLVKDKNLNVHVYNSVNL